MLSKRLEIALSFIENDLVLADIGCDHAFLAIEASKTKTNKVYAIDNKEKPLKHAIRNIKLAHVTDKVIPILSDGINDLASDVKQVSICGIGGELMLRILDNTKLSQIDYLILEANNDTSSIRKFLVSNGYKIIDEAITLDDGIYYEIIKACKGKQELNEKDFMFGPIIRKNKTEIFYKKWEYIKSCLLDIKSQMPTKYLDKHKEIDARLNMIEEELKDGV